MDGTAGRAGAALKRPDAEAAALRFDLVRPVQLHPIKPKLKPPGTLELST